MKTILSLITFATLALAAILPAKAQSYSPTTIISGGTNWVAAFSSNTYSAAIATVRYNDAAGFQVHGIPIGSNSVTLRLDFRGSVDGTVYASTNQLSWTFTVSTNTASANLFCSVTNLNVTGLRNLSLVRVANTELVTGVTNLTVTYGLRGSL